MHCFYDTEYNNDVQGMYSSGLHLHFFFRIVSSPEILRLVRERLSLDESTVNELATSNAKLQVDVATLQSQISSLTSQLTALQLANSQLVAEKEEVNSIVFGLCE